jgi:hypothetical protein
MEDTSNQAALDQLWAEYALAFQQAKEVVNLMSQEKDSKKRSELRKQLKSLDTQRVRILDQMDELNK